MTPRSIGTREVLRELEARAAAGALSVLSEVSLASFCTYRVGGNAAILVAVESVDDLEIVRAALAGRSVPTLVVGRGSNLLVADRGFDGVVVVLGAAFDEIRIERADDGGGRVILGASALLPVAARRTAAAGLTGFEWAVGVPGSIGGAVRMNAGGHGSDMAASLVSVSLFDLQNGGPEQRNADQLELGYRTSNIGAKQVVLFAELRLEAGDVATAEAEISQIVRWRREHQPGGQNAGSVFANPAGDSAGRLIEAAGLKGHRIGTAEVSTKHANFIQADPGGSADDVHALIHLIKRTINETDQIDLTPENRLIGFDDPTHAPEGLE